jgi:pyruvate dehydrogenase E1 component alpha subunit
MLRTRLFDQRAVLLQRTGKIGTYASSLGQEAISTAIGMAMHADDVFVPYYRDQGAELLRGVSMTDIITFWSGDERGSSHPARSQDLPGCIPIGTQMTHAAGIAAAMKLRGEKRAALATCGDGATSRGDFYEALNLAGVWHLPLVTVINNNQWAISMPLSAQTATPTLAQKALAAGMPGVRVDGNDVVAVYTLVQEALQRARSGKGPTLIEAVTYRLCDHTTADDMSRYADAAQREQAATLEPLRRLRAFLEKRGLWNDARQQAVEDAINAEIDAAEAAWLAQPPAPVTDMFDYLYAEMPAEMQAGRQALVRRLRREAP